MQVEQLPLLRLRPYPGNPRVPRRSVDKVMASLREFGWRQPIVVDRDHVIVVGHARFEAARRLELDTVPVHVAADLTEAQARAYRIMDNRSHEEAEWDREGLAAELAALEQGEEIPLALTGFEDAELAQLLTFELFEGRTEADAAPPSQPKRVRARRGDVFTAGPHRIVCGDARVREDLLKLMDGQAAKLAWTDPPYGVSFDGVKDGRVQKHAVIKGDALRGAELEEFLRRAMRSLFACLEPGGAVYVAHSDSEALAFHRAFAGAGFHLSGVLVWVKDRFMIGQSDYQQRHEPILYGWRPAEKGSKARRQWFGGRAQSTVLEIPRPRSCDLHPTMKPIELIESALENNTREGDVVVDLFGGSGSTLIACHKHARIARVLELDPVYVDVILARWQAYTGERPVRSDGVPFDELELREVA